MDLALQQDGEGKEKAEEEIDRDLRKQPGEDIREGEIEEHPEASSESEERRSSHTITFNPIILVFVPYYFALHRFVLPRNLAR